MGVFSLRNNWRYRALYLFQENSTFTLRYSANDCANPGSYAFQLGSSYSWVLNAYGKAENPP
jgi:hypothetical protein